MQNTDIHKMNLTNFDLNLLMVFNAVMRERNITQAGNVLGMSQPAVSNALNRLRHMLEDDLFIRGANGMRPTSRALELASPIRSALAEIEEALNPAVFDPAQATRSFTLASSDYIYLTLMPYIASYLSQEAPQMKLPLLSSPHERRCQSGKNLAVTVGPVFSTP